jgi:hypothetical protein
VRRAAADVTSTVAAGRMQRSSPVPAGRTAGSPAAGAGGGYGKTAAAAAGGSSSPVPGPRRATTDVGPKGSLHMMSRTSYLQVRALQQLAGRVTWVLFAAHAMYHSILSSVSCFVWQSTCWFTYYTASKPTYNQHVVYPAVCCCAVPQAPGRAP